VLDDVQAGSPSLLWSINARAVLETIDRGGIVTRPAITRATGLSKTTVAQTLAELEQRGIVLPAGVDDSGRGPAATRYTLNAASSYGLAADIGHRRTRVAIVDAAGAVLGRVEAPSARGAEADAVRTVSRLVDECCALAGVPRERLSRAIAGVPAVVDPLDSRLSLASGMPGEGRALPGLLAVELDVPLRFENDTNLAALAEQRDGRGADVSSFVLLSVGVGIGAGIVIDGRLHRGFRGAAGEVSYLPESGWRTGAPVGAPSVLADAAASGLDVAALDPRAVFDLARAGDPRALDAVDRTARRLAVVIASMALTLDPELFVLGGAIGSNGDLLLEPVRAHLDDVEPLARAEVVASALDDDAVLRGAATEVWQLIREAAFRTASAPAS
jgi:predicted NBD/HSP70 family sugar kinase